MSFVVIIPSKNADNLQKCVESVQANEIQPEIVVVDDGLVRFPAGVTVLSGIAPFAYSRNVNLAILAAGDKDCIVMNDDSRLFTQGGFSKLAEVGQGHGITSAAISDMVGNPNQFRKTNSAVRLEPRVLAFVCVFIPRATINAIGLLDERFCDCYGAEDYDYCIRARKAGLTLAVYDGCLVEHGVLPSTFATTVGRNCEPGLRILADKWGTKLGELV